MTAAIAPLKPPKSWFLMEEPNEPTALTFTADGQVYGHLALWDTCHTGFMNGDMAQCVKPPRSQSDYSFFHLGQIETEEGDSIAVGKLTYDTSHAPLSAGLQAASAHYDQTGSVGAFIRARDGRHGIWASGAIRSDLPPEGLRDLRANPPSGDWRSFRGRLELVAALAVVVPGFPIPRPELALAASGNGEAEIASLILPGYCGCEEEPLVAAAWTRAQMRKRRSLAAAVLTSKKRKSLAKSSFAIPEERAYPIHDRAHAANALARSAGKPEAGRVRAAVCKRYPDMPACKSKS